MEPHTMRNGAAQLLTSTLLAASLFGLAACSSDGTSRVSVRLTDAPGDGIEAAVITVSQVSLKGSGAQGEGSGDVVLRSEPFTTDLLTLANDTADLVDDALVPHGTYQELRFVISGGYVVVLEDGERRLYASQGYGPLPAGMTVFGELQMPSLSSSGLKVKFAQDADVTVSSEQEQKVILVDFDVAQSFGHAAGNSNRWVMHPVIKGADLEFSGSVAVTLSAGTSPLPQVDGVSLTPAAFSAVLVNVEGSEEPMAFTDTDADGVFEARFLFLLPGTYTLTVRGPPGVTFSTGPALSQQVTVSGGAESTVAFTLVDVAAAAAN
jgi:hypothetical protein